MDPNRRTFLKGVALTSLAVATPGFASGNILSDKANLLKGSTNLPIIALINSLPEEESAFLVGIRSAQQQQRSNDPIRVQRCDQGLSFLQSLQSLLHSGKPTQIIGLVDDASAAIIVDQARSASVRMHWLGQHAVSARQSRHNILTTDSGYGRGLRLAQQLNAAGTGFNLTEVPAEGHEGLRRMTFTTQQTLPNGNWAASLGFALTSLASDSIVQPDWVNAGAVSTPLLGNFASFSFQT